MGSLIPPLYLQLGLRRLVHSQISRSKAHYSHALDDPALRQERRDLAQGDPARAVDREAVRARADRREPDRPAAVFLGECEARPVATGEQFILAAGAAVPDGADGVDDVFG